MAKILVIGSGGREHAIAWKLLQSGKTEKVYVAPGNGGTAGENRCENVKLGEGAQSNPASPEGQDALIEFARRCSIDLTVVGPEDPLAAGIVDRFRKAGLAIVGPDQNAARLEASKIFSKDFMQKYGVRAARSKNVSDYTAALDYVRQHFAAAAPGVAAPAIPTAPGVAASIVPPLVIKAEGLAAGKGVVIAHSLAEAEATAAAFMKDRSLGAAGASLVLEEFLEGREVSVLAAVSVGGQGSGGQGPGQGCILPFVSARDHKSRFEQGKGPNTGGMGAIAPVPDFTEKLYKDFVTAILEPTLRGIEAEQMDYRGFIFFGLMICGDRCYLLEYNARLGDPETQAVLPLLDSDFVELCGAIVDGSLKDFPLAWKPGAVCAPVLVAAGYPGPYRKGDAIAVNKAALEKTGARLFVAGAREAPKAGASGGTGGSQNAPERAQEGPGCVAGGQGDTFDAEGGSSGLGASELVTSGGRVLALSVHGADAAKARAGAYAAIEAVRFEGMGYRADIGAL
jgi:phosphoribosylamine--glycine ligase